MLSKILKTSLRLIYFLVLILWSIWAACAVKYNFSVNPTLANTLPYIFAVLLILAVFFKRYRLQANILLLSLLLAQSYWWSGLKATGLGPWELDVAKLPWATVQDKTVTVHDIRNFDYGTNGEVTPAYYTKSFDLDKLSSVDLFSVYWMGDDIAHIIVSFGFEDKDFLAFSIEVRKRQGQEYSTLAGIFKNFELIYVAADEKDVLRLRTTYRKPQEDVYLFRLPMIRENAKKFFLQYIDQINQLHKNPEFYNTLTTNCTSNVLFIAQAIGIKARYSWKTLLSGHFAEYVYSMAPERVAMPFEEIRKLGHINAKSQQVDSAPDYSVLIREGVPYRGLVDSK